MKLWFALAMSLLAATGAVAQERRVAMHGVTPPATITADADTIVIPMDFSALRATVQVWLNGKGPYPFVFDTGAPSTVVDAELAKELQLAAIDGPRVMVADPSQKNAIGATRGSIDSLRVGGALVHDITFTGIPLRERFESKFLGVLGYPHFANYLLEIDYPGERIRLYEGALPPDGKGVIGYTQETGLIQFDVEIGGQVVASHLDSGSSGGFSVPPAVASQLAWSAEPESTRVAKSVANEAVVYTGRLDGAVSFAGLTYENPEVSYLEIMRDGNIGQQILQDLVITLDQRNKRLAFAKP